MSAAFDSDFYFDFGFEFDLDFDLVPTGKGTASRACPAQSRRMPQSLAKNEPTAIEAGVSTNASTAVEERRLQCRVRVHTRQPGFSLKYAKEKAAIFVATFYPPTLTNRFSLHMNHLGAFVQGSMHSNFLAFEFFHLLLMVNVVGVSRGCILKLVLIPGLHNRTRKILPLRR